VRVRAGKQFGARQDALRNRSEPPEIHIILDEAALTSCRYSWGRRAMVRVAS
jgi:hypothetical protein